MNVESLVGRTEVCSECGKQKKIELTLQQGKNKVKVTRLENGYRITWMALTMIAGPIPY